MIKKIFDYFSEKIYFCRQKKLLKIRNNLAEIDRKICKMEYDFYIKNLDLKYGEINATEKIFKKIESKYKKFESLSSTLNKNCTDINRKIHVLKSKQSAAHI